MTKKTTETNKLMNPMIDYAFKALFGESDEESHFLLIDLLNAILDLKDEEKIASIEYLNPYNDKEYSDGFECCFL